MISYAFAKPGMVLGLHILCVMDLGSGRAARARAKARVTATATTVSSDPSEPNFFYSRL